MSASANSAGPRAKRHRTETLQRRAVLEEQSPWTEGILEYLKVSTSLHFYGWAWPTETLQVSVTPRKFGQYPGACPLAPVFLKKGSRKFVPRDFRAAPSCLQPLGFVDRNFQTTGRAPKTETMMCPESTFIWELQCARQG